MRALKIFILLFFSQSFLGVYGTDTSLKDTFAIYLNKSIESRKRHQVQESIELLKKGRLYCKAQHDLAYALNLLGTSYFELSDYHTALKYYDSALVLTDSISNPVFLGYLYNNYGLVHTQLMDFNKAIDYYKKATEKVDIQSKGILHNNIAKCYEYLENSDSTLKYLRSSYSLNKSHLGKESFYTLLSGLELAEVKGFLPPDIKNLILGSKSNRLKGLLYSMEGKYDLAEEFLKKNYKSLLKIYVKSGQWKKAVNIIDTLRNSYLSVDSKLFLQANERLIYKNAIEEKLKSDTLSAFKIALKSHSNVLKENLDISLNSYPKSFNYFDFDSVTYLFIVSPTIRAYKINTGSTFQKHYRQFFSTLNLDWISNDFKENYRKFAESSYYLFKKLIPEYSDEMLIIPEGRIFNIPFDALLTELPDTTEYPYYKHMPFLLKKSDIRYDFILREYERPTKRKSIAAFAPDKSLEHAVKEVKQLWKYRSKRLIGKRAKKEKIHQGDILHIATHYDPYEYCLHFSDTALNINQIGELRKDLTILSTCYSGIGKHYTGEGTFSASRAFYMAGSESIVESLWPNNDKSAYMIFSNYYHFLKKRNPRGTSLTLSKRQYLEDCFHYMSHPFFWANLRFFGNNYPLKIESRFRLMHLLYLILAVMLFKYLFSLRRK